MRLLIVAAVAAVCAVVAVLVMKKIDGPWSGEDNSIRVAIAGAVAGVVSVAVSRKLRKES